MRSPRSWLYRGSATAFSAAAAATSGVVKLRPLIGTDLPQRRQRAVRLTVFPYLAGGTLSCIAGLFNPVGMLLVAISAAAASFGGTSGLAWMAQWLNGGSIPSGTTARQADIARSWVRIAASGTLAVVFIFALGPVLRL